MSLIIGTRDGVFRSKNDALNDIEHVLDSGNTLRVRTFENHEGLFAAAKTGLYRSMNDGTTWENLGVSQEVFSIVSSPDGTRLFAGTHPAHLYVSTDHGEVWQEIENFQKLPSRDQWHTPHHSGAQVCSLGVHPDAPERVIAGVEVGGIHISDDWGETWVERRDFQPERHSLHYDVHHILALGAEEYVVSCGGGLYRTRDTGETWTKLDDVSEQTYFVEAFAHQGMLYAGAQGPPWTWNEANGIDAALYCRS
jgi:photosystem II stability/assembly factor-like uncharacterized protein